MDYSHEEPSVCLVAYACEPGRGSEPGAGWSWALELAKRGNVFVVTRANNRDTIEGWRGWDNWTGPRPTFVYSDLPRGLAVWKRGQRSVHLYHYLWQLWSRRCVRQLVRTGKVNVAHHVTFGAYWYPSAAAGAGVPYLLGPLGGGEETPSSLKQFFSRAGRAKEALRWAVHRLAELDPFVRGTVRGAAMVYPTTPETANRLRAMGCHTMEPMAHVGFTADYGDPPAARHTQEPEIRLLSVSRLEEWKGVEIALRAIAQLQSASCSYTVLGEGPARARLERLAVELGLGERVRFLDRMADHGDVRALYARSDVFLHLATHESGGMSVAEAMAASLPCVVLALGGPGVLVDERCGYAIEADADVVSAVSSALRSLSQDLPLRESMGAAGRARILSDFNWADKADVAWREYGNVLGGDRHARAQ